MDDVIETTPELKPDGEYYGGYMRSSDGDWAFCLDILHALWDFPQKATCWLELTRTHKPHAWKIRLEQNGPWDAKGLQQPICYIHHAIFLDSDCPCLREEVVGRLGLKGVMRRVIPAGETKSPELYVRLFYQEA